MEINNQSDKIDLLINKLNQYENNLKDERKLRIKLEEEINNYKNIVIPTLEKQIEDKESFFKSAFIENISLKRENMKINVIVN